MRIDKDIVAKFLRLTGSGQFVIAEKDNLRRGAFRRGVATLIEGVIELGSLDKAARTLYMGDSTARRVLAETERTLGFKLVETAGRLGSRPTSEGQLLLDIYRQGDLELKTFASMRFDEIVEDDEMKVGEGSLERVMFGFHGTLPALLLREIEDTGSVKVTAKKMRVTRKKALEILHGIEASIGYPLVATRSHSALSLTPEGKKHLAFLETCFSAMIEEGNWESYGAQ
jgi:molybdenum-dependent DNA-binding transcriptional regulator ModE